LIAGVIVKILVGMDIGRNQRYSEVDMSRASYENYGRLATTSLPPLQTAGRYPAQAEAERLMPLDVAQKLDLKPTDRLLDIGCGPGTNLIPLSFLVQSAMGVDHPETIKALSSRVKLSNVEYLAGNFLDLEIVARFTKIVIYSVLHYLASEEEVVTFLRRACDLLEPGGRLLVGDMPNTDLRRRFQASSRGKEFQIEWNKRIASTKGATTNDASTVVDPKLFEPDDGAVLRLLGKFRSSTTHAWILPQRVDLPFGYTREDLLILKL
jgi:2-polyprenyl-3-methyl-5-hydroxy-6-metoxy-1,4-benzoquinol methylase